MKFSKFLILGGDLRNIYLHDILKREGNKVKIYGFSEYSELNSLGLRNVKSLKRAVASSEIIIGPTPCCNNGLNLLNTPFSAASVSINDLFQNMQEGQIFIAGRISNGALSLAAEKNITAFDILEREEMAILNAIPTAEGAIQIAFEKMKTTLHQSNAMVIGYGRTGKFLSMMLQGIGANVHVVARKYSDASLIRGYGYKSLSYDELPDNLGKMDVIFNTVPSVILDKTNLSYIKPDCVIIDIASKPFGVDPEEAKRAGISVTWAPSLPGKVAPITAASYIKETIYNIINEMGD